MLKLKKCKFTGIPGIQTLELDFSKITTFTGPNGTGKSTVLKILDLAFRILEEREVCDKLPQHDPWHLFETAEISFECEEPLQTKLISDIDLLTISIDCDNSSYYISGISSTKQTLTFQKPILKSELQHWNEEIVEAKVILNQIEMDILKSPPHIQEQTIRDRKQARNIATEKETSNSKLIDQNKLIHYNFEEGDKETSATILRSEFIDSLKILRIPTIRLITTQNLLDQDIPELINHLIDLKKGDKNDSKKFKSSEECLNRLLQSEIDVSDKKDIGTRLLIHGISYEKASTGTYLTLSFFALTEREDPNKIVLWDEPENGLHPTRRIQLLELMRADGRQFIIATHATEFAPILQSDNRVYRCVTDYDEEFSKFKFSVISVATRREAFATLEALGIHPARTLFTANVVIWIEGPTELVFYRHWLSRRLAKDGYQEGLHYSFMQYGGSLINYLEVADDGQFKSTIDLLSHCRFPVVLVDSDISEEHPSLENKHLKEGAQRISNQIKILNDGRRGAAIFQATQGREIENYLPKSSIFFAIEKLWKEFSIIKDSLPIDEIDLGKYRKYPEAIEEFLKKHKILDSKGLPKGRSIWGPSNKVAMMSAALSMPNLDEDQLNFNCIKDLNEIDIFIRSKHEVEYSNGLKK
ncbi:AAA family ATPase [Janthinobacterium sp. SUN211]|uniref:AAA family ATPase n=1 Tax=Janthinobacterium sp. SUN211 TaxID=3014786 RepID=UPI002712FB86|nr:AAA family ATPase [Janthinobacterium sp. SUN211]MDO8050710.1 AAA family ATPase [Janthinobacterium sp. SUN211]